MALKDIFLKLFGIQAAAGVSRIFDEENKTFRTLGSGATRDPIAWKKLDLIRKVLYVYETNPIAHRVIQVELDFVWGNGVKIECTEPACQKIVDEFLELNEFNLRFPKRITELCLFGELLLVLKEDGSKFKMASVDTQRINEIKLNSFDRDEYFEITVDGNSENSQTFKHISKRGVGTFPNYLGGDCIYQRINDTMISEFGRSDLTTILDWLDAYDTVLAAEGDRAARFMSYVWDILIKGATAKDIAEYKETLTNPTPGTVNIHNENIEWKAITPDLGGADLSYVAKLLKNQIITGVGLAEHWLAEGGDVNRATAKEMAEPILRRLLARQNLFKALIQKILTFVLDQSVIKGILNKAERDKNILNIAMTPIFQEDENAKVQNLKTIADTLANLLTFNLISRGDAVVILKAEFWKFGFELKDSDNLKTEAAAKVEEVRKFYAVRKS